MGQCLSAIAANAHEFVPLSTAFSSHGPQPQSDEANHSQSHHHHNHPHHHQGLGKPVPAYPHIIQHAYVNKMPDGDTIMCSYRHPDGSTASVRVRIMAIDCPELAQNYGEEAKQLGQALLLHKTVTLHPKDVDRYGRLVADVVTHGGVNYAQYMLKNGAAWHYKQYDQRADLAQLEADARANRIGLWSFPRPQAPWDYRRRRRNRMSNNNNNNNNNNRRKRDGGDNSNNHQHGGHGRQQPRRSMDPSSHSSRNLNTSRFDSSHDNSHHHNNNVFPSPFPAPHHGPSGGP